MVHQVPSETRQLAAGDHLRLVVRNGWEFVERPRISGIVVIVGTTRHGCLVLVTQWREPVAAPVVEWPAGLAGDLAGSETEALEEAARRELFEETGFRADTDLTWVWWTDSATADVEPSWWLIAAPATTRPLIGPLPVGWT